MVSGDWDDLDSEGLCIWRRLEYSTIMTGLLGAACMTGTSPLCTAF
jgi:hypothetical protein